MARGDEWLRHEGTVGRPVGCEIVILDERGRELDVGQVGNIFLRRIDGEQGFRYLGDAEPGAHGRRGFSTYGDLGMARRGRLPLHRRSPSRHDRFRGCQCLSGGSGVGTRRPWSPLPTLWSSDFPTTSGATGVHAIVELTRGGPALGPEELRRFAGTAWRLTRSQSPIEFVDRIPRSEAGKVNRSTLVAERTGTAHA